MNLRTLFPTSVVYELNLTKTICTNGGTVSQDLSNKTVSVSVTSTDYCTLYYDYKETTLSDYVISLADTETTPDFSQIANTDEGVFAMEDDYGELSYYFRGAVENNYILFGEYKSNVYFGYYSSDSSYYLMYNSLDECENATSYNYNCQIGISAGAPIYWRIARINGDGTIRLIYDGTTTHKNGESSYDRYIYFYF